MAQFPRVESFKNSTATSFTLGGAATLTAKTGADPNGAGYLRLTSAVLNQAGFAIDQGQFPASNGFSISFEFFAYGGTGADGFSVFLVDAAQTSAATFVPGADGGSLGYAQKTVTPTSNGVPFGYIGIGIDEFGNYSNGTEGRSGGINTPDRTPNAVALRGSGNGNSASDYPYLTGTPTLPFSLDVATVRAQSGSPDYRRAYIDVVPTSGTYRITVRIQHGFTVETAIRNFVVPRPPNNLRIGFAGSTGNQTNVHEIRNLAIRQTPFLDDDVASTTYNQPVSLNVLSNDIFSYANYSPGSVDLDPDQAGIQSSLTLPGQGRFAVTSAGVVTFIPSGTFAGVITIPYTANDVLGETGSLANITLILRGADITNTVSGPTAAAPGNQVQYTVTTSNLGSLPATNVIPTLQLPAGLSGVVVSNSGSYASGTGLVTFSPSATLAAGGAPATNTVSFIAPASGSVTGTTDNTATQPDPVSENNVSSVTTIITGLANVASVCATPGNDGLGVLGATSAPNTYFPGVSTTTSGGTSSIVLGPALTGARASSAPIAAGDLVLVMQMQGAVLNTANDASYGSGGTQGKGNLTGSGDQFTAGLYEYAIATNTVGTGGGTLTLSRALANTYDNLDYNASSNPTGQRRFQVVRVPQYSTLTVADSVAGAAWNGATGGVLALDVAGRTIFAPNARLTMTGRGFRGGGGKRYTGNAAYSNTDFRQLSSTSLSGSGGAKGEGTAGTPAYVNSDNYTATINTGQEGYRNGSNGRGAPGNAGGGGTDLSPNDNARNTGGGGGANGGEGGFGGYGNSYVGNVTDNAQGIGGAAFGASAGRLTMGGGGGAGVTDKNNGGVVNSGGNSGGGIIMLRTGSVLGIGAIRTNGLAGATTTNNGAGGGGAGGTVLLLVGNSSTLSSITVSARGGRGGRSSLTGAAYGPGGGGGGGVVLTNGAITAASSVAGGANGTTGGIINAFGATNGTAGTILTNTTTTGSGNADCLPALTVAVSTTTPRVTRSGGTNGPVNPALYTINVSNTGGTATGVTVLGSLRNNLFKYDGTFPPTATMVMPNGTTTTPTGYALPTNGVSQPVFTGFTIPSGAALKLTFRATIDAAAQNGVPYPASATVSYDNPLRTSLLTATVQPGENYAGGIDTSLGSATGSNYAGRTGTPENVTIQAPLPVALARFTAVAAHPNAQLRWLTASEQNNDQFVVERSFDGTLFTTLGSVRGQRESAKPTDYEFVDANVARLVAPGKLVYYRLRQVDLDGTSTYSPVRTIVFGAKGAVTLYPNPAGQLATLDLSSLTNEDYAVQVLDLTGRQVAAYSLPGAAQHPLDLQRLAAGTYMVRVRGGAVNQSLLLTRE